MKSVCVSDIDHVSLLLSNSLLLWHIHASANCFPAFQLSDISQYFSPVHTWGQWGCSRSRWRSVLRDPQWRPWKCCPKPDLRSSLWPPAPPPGLWLRAHVVGECEWIKAGSLLSTVAQEAFLCSMITWVPKLCSCRAAASPDAPAPMMITFFWKQHE